MTTLATSPDAPPSRPVPFEPLGRLVWLWMSSPLHRGWGMEAAARFLLPALHLGQVEILERDGMPVAYCSWARMSEEAELRYVRQASGMQVADWNSGDRLWFVDWVAPFGAADSRALKARLVGRFEHEVARAIRVKRHSPRGRVMEFKGRALDTAEADRRLEGYYSSLLCRLRDAAHGQGDGRPLTVQPRAHPQAARGTGSAWPH